MNQRWLLLSMFVLVIAGCGSAPSAIPASVAAISTATARTPSATATPVATGGSSDAGAASPAPPELPGLFSGLPFAMDLPGWLGGGPARWDAQIQSLTASGTAPDKLADLKGFDAPITGPRLFAIDAATDLAVFVDSGVLPAGQSDEAYLSTADKMMIAAAQQDGQIVTQPVIDRVSALLGGSGSRISYVTRSVNRAGIEFKEARVAYVFRVDDVGYLVYFTFPVSDNRYDAIADIVSTFHLQSGT